MPVCRNRCGPAQVRFTFAQLLVLFRSHWTGDHIVLAAIRTLYLEPRLDQKDPLSRGKQSRRIRRWNPKITESVEDEASSK
jgi:hypothetical protein